MRHAPAIPNRAIPIRPAAACLVILGVLVASAATAPAAGAASSCGEGDGDRSTCITAVRDVPVWYDAERARWGEIETDTEWTTRRVDYGRAIEVEVDLPDVHHADAADTNTDNTTDNTDDNTNIDDNEGRKAGRDRIIARVTVEPVMKAMDNGRRPGDPWPRLGRVSLVDPDDERQSPRETELMRFITPFGGSAEFTADVTSYAPLLNGPTTLRLMVDTWTDPAWKLSLELEYRCHGAGYRRPTFARRVFPVTTLTAEEPAVSATVCIPEGLARPRLIVFSTGHATDGDSGDEFVTRTNILRVNGEMLARWRPWREGSAADRELNPTSGRREVDGRKLWSSDLDRSGWLPGRSVEPMILPVAELTPGEHEIELTVRDIRPTDDNGRGFWVVSAIVVADDPWPESQEQAQHDDTPDN